MFRVSAKTRGLISKASDNLHKNSVNFYIADILVEGEVIIEVTVKEFDSVHFA